MHIQYFIAGVLAAMVIALVLVLTFALGRDSVAVECSTYGKVKISQRMYVCMPERTEGAH